MNFKSEVYLIRIKYNLLLITLLLYYCCILKTRKICSFKNLKKHALIPTQTKKYISSDMWT